jgi:putative SOS response-associated peptidase YedK
MHDGASEGVMMRWGLIPSWTEVAPAGKPKWGVGVDGAETGRIYRGAWAAGQRCILPFAGFYVWQRTPQGHRQPFYVRLLERSVFGVAALWDRWVSDDDDVIESCALIRVPANALLSSLADDRRGMPAVLRRRHYEAWLSGSVADAKAALLPYPPGRMEAYAVSPRINSRSADDPGLISAAA